ncbi:hypothetical protein KCP73_25475 [Salmonella enterica subsp. enterica]|nr:hypothetical protein KCP73_25475 [Salmonella enterica subsp. enterica]
MNELRPDSTNSAPRKYYRIAGGTGKSPVQRVKQSLPRLALRPAEVPAPHFARCRRRHTLPTRVSITHRNGARLVFVP